MPARKPTKRAAPATNSGFPTREEMQQWLEGQDKAVEVVASQLSAEKPPSKSVRHEERSHSGKDRASLIQEWHIRHSEFMLQLHRIQHVMRKELGNNDDEVEDE